MESISLYFALKLRGVPAILEEQTGFRTIDILVPHARLNIELEAAGNNFKPDRAIQELETALDGFKNGFLTLRIPESSSKNYLDDAADKISDCLAGKRPDQLRWKFTE